MLSRVADSLYWLGRYVERAENTARVLDTNLQLTLDGFAGVDPASPMLWQPLVAVSGDENEFSGNADRDSVLRFYTSDGANPNSILSCLATARENARSVRDTISSTMWRQVNELYLWVKGIAAEGGHLPEDFFERVKREGALFHGLSDTTMTHGEGWHFLNLGRLIERADKTSRILEVKAMLLIGGNKEIGTASDLNQWSALLRSVSAFEMYRKRHPRTSARQVVTFLIADPDFPRSCRWCTRHAHESLLAIAGDRLALDHQRLLSERLLGRLRADLDYVEIDEVFAAGVGVWCDAFQARLTRASSALIAEFLSLKA